MTGRRLATVALIVADYDDAIAWFTEKLGFLLLQDIDLGGGKRWVVVAPETEGGVHLLLAKAADSTEMDAVGNQAGGRVFLFLETDDFARDHAAMTETGVEFTEAPRQEPYGSVAVFRDLCGNLWDLIEPAATRD